MTSVYVSLFFVLYSLSIFINLLKSDVPSALKTKLFFKKKAFSSF